MNQLRPLPWSDSVNCGVEMPISDGKVQGDDISFTVTMTMGGNSMKMLYTGKVSADEIKFTSQLEGAENKREFTAKKSAS